MRCLHCFVLSATLAAMAASSAAGDLTLYQPIRSGSDGEWVDVRIALQAGTWRAGRPDGRAASPAELREALQFLGSVALAIDCNGETQGPTHYPCALELGNVVIERADRTVPVPASGWSGATGDTMRFNGGGSVMTYSSHPDALPLFELLPAGVLPAPGMAALVAPARLAQALKGPDVQGVAFRWRVQFNELAPARALRSQGMLILTTRKPPAASMPARL